MAPAVGTAAGRQLGAGHRRRPVQRAAAPGNRERGRTRRSRSRPWPGRRRSGLPPDGTQVRSPARGGGRRRGGRGGRGGRGWIGPDLRCGGGRSGRAPGGHDRTAGPRLRLRAGRGGRARGRRAAKSACRWGRGRRSRCRRGRGPGRRTASRRSIRDSRAPGESSASGWVSRTSATSRLTRGSGASRMATRARPRSSIARTRAARPTAGLGGQGVTLGSGHGHELGGDQGQEALPQVVDQVDGELLGRTRRRQVGHGHQRPPDVAFSQGFDTGIMAKAGTAELLVMVKGPWFQLMKNDPLIKLENRSSSVWGVLGDEMRFDCVLRYSARWLLPREPWAANRGPMAVVMASAVPYPIFDMSGCNDARLSH